MGFSNNQRIKIYAWLGYAPRFLGLDTRVENAIAALGQDPDAQALVEGYLAELATIDAQRAAARRRRDLASLGKGDVVWEQTGQQVIEKVARDGMRVVGRLASLLGVSARHNVFAPSTHVDTGPALTPLMGPSGGYMKIG